MAFKGFVVTIAVARMMTAKVPLNSESNGPPIVTYSNHGDA